MIVKGDGFVFDVPRETKVSEGGGEILALIRVPWDVK